MAVHDGPGERRIENPLHALRAPLACIFLDAVLRHVRTARVMILDIAQRRRAGLVEPPLHPREVAHARRMRQVVRRWPDAGEEWNELCPRVRERELDGLRCGRRLMPQDRRIEVEKSGDEFLATLERCALDDLRLKLHEGFAEQPRLTL